MRPVDFTPPPFSEQDAADRYRAREQRHAARRADDEARSRLISRLRLTTFLSGVALMVWAGAGDPPFGSAVAVTAAALFAAFVALVVWHARVEDRRAWHDALASASALGAARMARDWNALPAPDTAGPDEDHAYAADLDVFGHASLLQLLAPGTAAGRQTLVGWLLAPAPPDEVRARQETVRALAPNGDFREQLAAHARFGASQSPDLEAFLAWAEAPPRYVTRGWLVWSVRGLTGIIWVLGAAWWAGWTTIAVWFVPVLAGLALSFAFGKGIAETFGRAFSRGRAFRRYADLFALVCRLDADAPWVAERRASLCGRGTALRDGAVASLRRLDRLMALADLRFAMALLHLVVQAVTLWDFHVLFALERWQQAAGARVRGWMSALGEVDAAAALATLAHDHPGWSTPVVVQADGPPRIRATALAHPLIAASVRVANDVEVGPPGTFLLVTGSNMSGKSTLLRAIGLNVALAQAGGPVCAAVLEMPAARLRTSMRVHDSLEQGLSYFMAALARLKTVVDASRAGRDGGPVLLYLLDEILQGTNSAERRIAVRSILSRLLADGAIGAVTTHDLALAEAPEAAVARLVHFSETVEQAADGFRMTFDYRLRSGLARSRNALLLMKMVGLEPSGGEAAAPAATDS